MLRWRGGGRDRADVVLPPGRDLSTARIDFEMRTWLAAAVGVTSVSPAQQTVATLPVLPPLPAAPPE